MVSRFIDLHEDFGITSLTKDVYEGDGQSSFKALGKFEDVTIFAVVFPLTRKWLDSDAQTTYTQKPGVFEYYPDQNNLLRQIKFYHSVERNGFGKIVRKREDLDGKGIKMLLALEGTDTVSGLEDIHFLRDNGVRSIGFTWNLDTKFAASCMSQKDYGLTGSGEELVRLCNDLGMAIDMGHASDRTIIEVSEISKSPVIVSHTNPKSFHDVRRNISDEAIEAVIKKGGVIGITSITSTLGKDPTIDTLVESMRYVGETFGWEYVSLGSDFLGIATTTSGFENVGKINDLADKLGEHADEVLWKNALRALRASLK